MAARPAHLPAYWVALTAAIVLFGATKLSGFWDYARHYLLVQIYQPKYGLAGIVPTWTLAVELSFYATLPLYAWVLGAVTSANPSLAGSPPRSRARRCSTRSAWPGISVWSRPATPTR